MKAFLKKVLAFGLGSMFLLSPLQAAEVEVLHWWTSGGEAAALNVLKEDLQSKGIGWKDMPVAGGGGTQAMTVLRSRVTSGTAPTAVQMLGFDILDWAAEGVLADLNRIARQGNWDAVVPLALQKFSKYDGQWISVPVNVHSTNWVWANKAVFEKVGVTVPRNWDEFVAVTKKIKAAGYTPIAHGGQAWQDATVFDSILLSVGGYDFYKKTMVDLNLKALGSAKMVQVFDRMRVITGLLDPNFSGRDWNLASAMVINEKAAMQIMGDWAKGEFAANNMAPGKDYICAPTPSNNGYLYNVDSFIFYKVEGKDKVEGQKLLASLMMGKNFQKVFNIYKGSIPARLDVSMDEFDMCAKKSNADLKTAGSKGGLLPSFAHGMALRLAQKGAIQDVVTEHFNSNMSSSDAAKKLAAAVKASL